MYDEIINENYYETIGTDFELSHDVVIVGYYEDDGEKGVVVADSNIAVTGYTYMVPWDYLKEHLKDDADKLILTEGNRRFFFIFIIQLHKNFT